jgi:hypothetical protein
MNLPMIPFVVYEFVTAGLVAAGFSYVVLLSLRNSFGLRRRYGR